MLVRHLAIAAFAASILASSAFAASFGGGVRGGQGPDSKDHTPLLEACAAYQKEFTRAIADQPVTRKTAEAQRLFRDGVHLCREDQTKTTQGANEISEALQLIGAQPRIF
jgi:hypothetical protein